MYFPEEVFRLIFGFFPYPYRTPPHYLALKRDVIYQCFLIKTDLFYKYNDVSEWNLLNNYFAYRRWFISKRERILSKN